jgi:hypothetical protein
MDLVAKVLAISRRSGKVKAILTSIDSSLTMPGRGAGY